VLNQFSMDEYAGYFRIATTFRTSGSSQNNVYVLDMDLNIVGRLEGLAPKETIYSARFMGDRCYLVTFRKVDPLFVIDLKNPYDPEVLGQLKITGYSDYLHPYDEDHVIGVGKETVEAEQGDFSWYQGVKISLFDVSDVENPKEIAKYEIGDRGTDSPVLSDHKAFLFDKLKNLLVMPVSVAEIDENKYLNGVPLTARGDFVWQGAYVFDISLDEGLVLKGRITHLEDDSDLMKSGYYFSSPFSVKRSLYIDNVLYTISDKKIKMNSLEDLEQINEIELL
jgi:inhibitor of cysteine peptidase